MAEYQDVLRYLVQNPPRKEPDKRMHALLLEMLAKKLRGEDVKIADEVMTANFKVNSRNKRLH